MRKGTVSEVPIAEPTWEKGTSEPNTSNLMALAKLYGIPAEDLLRGVESALEEQKKS